MKEFKSMPCNKYKLMRPSISIVNLANLKKYVYLKKSFHYSYTCMELNLKYNFL